MKVCKNMYQIDRWIWLHNQIQTFPYICSMRVKFKDNGEEVTFLTAEELVNYMRKTSFDPEENNASYMVGYARRSVIIADEDIRATSEKEFVEDLLKHKHITIVDGYSAN